MLYVSHLVLYVYSNMSNVVNLYVRFSCMCIYCLYLRRRQKCLNHSAIHLTCLYIYLHPVLYMYMSYVVNLCLLIMYVYCMYLSCMYLSWRHGRTASWPSCLSRLKNLIKNQKKIHWKPSDNLFWPGILCLPTGNCHWGMEKGLFLVNYPKWHRNDLECRGQSTRQENWHMCGKSVVTLFHVEHD